MMRLFRDARDAVGFGIPQSHAIAADDFLLAVAAFRINDLTAHDVDV